MADTEEKSIAEKVNDFLSNMNHSEEDCFLVFTLYNMVLDLATDNSCLDMEVSMLNRQIDIAERAIIRLNEEKDKVYTA